MYEQLKTRVAEMIVQPRPLKPQTQRQLSEHSSEESEELTAFLLDAANQLEDYELDILFGPQFTPTLDDRAALTDLLFHWRPTESDLAMLVRELSTELDYAVIEMPDLSNAKLAIHEVMIDRYVKLLRLNHAPAPAIAATLRDVLPPELWQLAVALACERGFSAEHQQWFAAFINHVAEQRSVTEGMLRTVAEFIARQQDLSQSALEAAGQSLLRATKDTANQAASGHTYWSPDVAQHHSYRGQGDVNQDLVQQRQNELEWAEALVADLQSFTGVV